MSTPPVNSPQATAEGTAMAKGVGGTVRRKRLKDGSVTYSIRFEHRGRKWEHRLGNSKDGWTEERVQAERKLQATLIARGEYVLPEPEPVMEVGSTTAPRLPVAAAAFLARREAELAPKSLADLEWRLRHAVDFFGNVPVDQLTHAQLEDFKVAKLAERQTIEEAAAKGKPVMEEYEDVRGRTCRRRRRGLDKLQVNKVLAVVDRLLEDAVARDELQSHPALGSARQLRMKIRTKKRSFLELYQATALFDAARAIEDEHRGLTWEKVDLIRSSPLSAVKLAKELHVSDVLIGKVRRNEIWTEREGKRNRNDVPRLAPIVTLLLLGVRIQECCALDGGDLDFARGTVKIRASKTEAGEERVIPMLPLAREILQDHVLDRPCGPTSPVFLTRTGRRQSPDNLRSTILAPAVGRANELLDYRGLPPIVALTPHSLRRTFASLLAECGVPMPRAMQLLGHTDPKMTVGVYQQVMQSDPEQFEKVTGATLEDAFNSLRARPIPTPFRPLAEKKAASEVGHDPR